MVLVDCETPQLTGGERDINRLNHPTYSEASDIATWIYACNNFHGAGKHSNWGVGQRGKGTIVEIT